MEYDVILLAAGESRRFNARINKVFMKLDHRSVLQHSLDFFYNDKHVSKIHLVINRKDIKFIKEISTINYNSKLNIVIGGNCRSQSVKNALKYLSEKSKYILIHDGARPFFRICNLFNLKDIAYKGNNAIFAIRSYNSIKYSNDNINIKKTINRDHIWLSQTPQIFQKNVLLYCYKNINNNILNKFTDDSEIVENILDNVNIKIVEGSKFNIKITTKEDFYYARYLLDNNFYKN